MSVQSMEAATYICTTVSSNDAQYVYSSGQTPTADGDAQMNAGGWSVFRVYYYDGSYGTGYTYNAALIELDLSQIPENQPIERATLHLKVINVIQQYNNDYSLALLDHRRSSLFTGNAYYDLQQGITSEVEDVGRFLSGSSSGWKEFDVTQIIQENINAGILWAVFWLSPAPWEDQYQIIGELKGVSIASADYLGRIY